MDQVWIKEETLTAMGDAVRARAGVSGMLSVEAMAEALGNIKGSGKYLFSKVGEGGPNLPSFSNATGTSVLVTADDTMPEIEIEYCSPDITPIYNEVTKHWEFSGSTIVTLKNTDMYVPQLGEGESVIMRVLSAAGAWFLVTNFLVETMNISGTVTKSVQIVGIFMLEKSDVLGYAVSDDLEKYPDSGWKDGYYWECVGGKAKIIEFQIGTAGVYDTFQAEEGMTWAEWCDSEYNTDSMGWYISGNVVAGAGGAQISTVKPTDVIIAGSTYTHGK